MWCGLLHDRVVGPFFFVERAITGDIYLDLLEQIVFPQLVLFSSKTAPHLISVHRFQIGRLEEVDQ
jgi:hypothetical protein